MSAKIEEIFDYDEKEPNDLSENEEQEQNDGTTVGVCPRKVSNLADQIASLENNDDFLDRVLGKESNTQVLHAMDKLLKSAKPSSSIEDIIKAQGRLFESAEVETWTTILQSCPKEIFYVGIPCLTILVLKSGETLVYILAAVLICFIVAKTVSYLEMAQRNQLTAENRVMQVQAVQGEAKLGKEIATELATTAKEVQVIRANTAVRVTEINKATVESRLLALSQMQAAEIEGNKTIAKLRQDGATGREQLIQTTKVEVAQVKAAAEKLKAELLKQSKLELANMEMEQTKLKETAARDIKKIETDMEIKIEELRSAAQDRKTQFESDQDAKKKAHEMKLAEDKLRSEAEIHAKDVNLKKEIELKRIEKEINEANEVTRRIEIQERHKTEREKCSIQ